MKIQSPNTSLRDQAIEKARARIQLNGSDTLKLSDVARDLGVTHAALYKYFANKQDLIDAVNIQWMDEINATLLAVCDKVASPGARIRQWFLTLYQLRRDKVLSNASEYASYIRTEELGRPCAQQDALERKYQLIKLIEEAMHAGEMRKSEPVIVADVLFAAADHFIHPAFVASHAVHDKSTEFERLLHVVLCGLSTKVRT